jgi:hypothetical protein
MAFLRVGVCRRSELSVMNRCEVVGVRNLSEAEGFPCSQIASKQCSDCGIEICDSHVETCGMCHGVFCPSCLSFHQAEHSKPATAVPSKGKKRRTA